ncbi:hypothetical protein [Nocardia altamirensis]|uniref:hypothetical protein n=1 Tax=Nocardia altamirensis TaxID=472158 RepID=UPI00083FF0A0|nr:hypothetical protein [Nocardia altamirensis]
MADFREVEVDYFISAPLAAIRERQAPQRSAKMWSPASATVRGTVERPLRLGDRMAADFVIGDNVVPMRFTVVAEDWPRYQRMHDETKDFTLTTTATKVWGGTMMHKEVVMDLDRLREFGQDDAALEQFIAGQADPDTYILAGHETAETLSTVHADFLVELGVTLLDQASSVGQD